MLSASISVRHPGGLAVDRGSSRLAPRAFSRAEGGSGPLQLVKQPRKRKTAEQRARDFLAGPMRFGPGSRQTLTSRRARAARKARNARARRRAMARAALAPGSYAQQYVEGSELVNRGRRHRLAIEVDHIPTDSSQRGGIARAARVNRDATLRRPAFALPRSWHRAHPTTVGGRGTDWDFRRLQREHVEGLGGVYRCDDSKIWTGHAAGIAMHLDAYEPIVNGSSIRGKNVFSGVRANARQAIHRAHQNGAISRSELRRLTAKANRVFRDR